MLKAVFVKNLKKLSVAKHLLGLNKRQETQRGAMKNVEKSQCQKSFVL